MGIVVGFLLLLGHFHWIAGLVGFSIWLPWSIFGRRALRIVPGWQGWLFALVAIVSSTSLTERPSGLALAGLLQWLSLGGGILALQDVLRDRSDIKRHLWWWILATGVYDAFVWTHQLILQHMVWWQVRTDDLPLFPFRIRLFGSHGATQAAAWLGALLILGAAWGVPRLGSGWRFTRLLGLGVLLWWAILLGMCDSRLALGALFAALAMLMIREGGTIRFLVIGLVPALIWIVRDRVHPSQVMSGGGSGGMGWLILVTWATSVAVALVARRFLGACETRGWKRHAMGWGMVALPALPLTSLLLTRSSHLDTWTTGRLVFWIEAVRAIASRPIFGPGPWGYVWEYSVHQSWGFSFLAMHPHNAALEVVLAGGAMLLVAVGVIAIATLRWDDLSWDECRETMLLGAFLAISMCFDSPLSSPQLVLLVIVLGAQLVARLRVREWKAVPRSLAFAPALLLVPASILFEAQIGKSALAQAGEKIRNGAFREGAADILGASTSDAQDPQWLRNRLMARTALNSENPDSLRVYGPLWDSLVGIEPGFYPNRLHLAWLNRRLDGSKTAESAYAAAKDHLWILDSPSPAGRSVPSSWKDSYPTDSPAFWFREANAARIRGDIRRYQWICVWMEHRLPPSGVQMHAWRRSQGLKREVQIRAVQEQQLYGADGSRWLLIPQVQAEF